MDNVYLYDGKSSHYNEAVLDNYLNNKVKQYAKQDREAKRKWSSNYITKDWLKSQFGKRCSGCGDCLTFSISGNKVYSNLSADRKHNDEPHDINNIVPMCVDCNVKN